MFFDKLVIQFKKGRLKQETHYYPFGLPITGLGSEDFNLMPNRHRYQGNEWITESGLNWMSFGARQYDPQLGRFLGVDPLASIGGQERLSPFHAMGNNPVSLVDPNGLFSGLPATFQYASFGTTETGWEGIGETAHSAMERLMGGNYSDFYSFSGGGGGALTKSLNNLDRKVILNMLNGYFYVNFRIGGMPSGPFYAFNGGGFQFKDGGEGKKNVYEEVTYVNKCIIYRLNDPEAVAWDLDGDGKLSKSEADKWYVNGKGVPIIVDNSKIDWSGLEIPKGKNNGDEFSIKTSQAFWYLPYETSSTYGGTSFKVVDANKGIVEVQRQGYHYEYRNSNSVENVFRNIATGIGMPTPFNATGQAYMIFYYNPIIYIKNK